MLSPYYVNVMLIHAIKITFWEVLIGLADAHAQEAHTPSLWRQKVTLSWTKGNLVCLQSLSLLVSLSMSLSLILLINSFC